MNIKMNKQNKFFVIKFLGRRATPTPENGRVMPSQYHLPTTTILLLYRLLEAEYISSLDLRDGYWQTSLEENSKRITAFTMPARSLLQWKVMPFDLHRPRSNTHLTPALAHKWRPTRYHCNTKNFRRTTCNLRELYRRIHKANLCINAEKCEFVKRKVLYLGHV